MAFFVRHQRVLLWCANTWLGKLYLTSSWDRARRCMAWRWIDAPRFDQLTPSAFTFRAGLMRDGRARFISKHYSGNHFAEKVARVLFWLPYAKAERRGQGWVMRPAFAYSVVTILAALCGVPAMAATVDTFNSAAGSSSPVDGTIRTDTNAVWNTTRADASGTGAVDDEAEGDMRAGLDGTYQCRRVFMLFDTGGTLTSSATVVSATLTVNCTGVDADGDSTSITVVQTRPASDSTLANDDVDQITPVPVTVGVAMTEGIDSGERFPLASFPASHAFPLNSTGLGWIAISGETKPSGAPSANITRLGLVITRDATDSAPTADNECYCSLADNGSDKPELSVTWTVPAYRPISVRVDYHDGDDWVDITENTRAVDELHIDYGIRGAGPLDVMASTGTCAFLLSNRNPVGQYSPAHADVATGWGVGTPIRVVFITTDATEIVKFRGTVQVVDPEAGQYGRKAVSVLAHDYMSQLADARITNIEAQVDQTDKALIEAVYAAIPSEFQPPATSIDDAIDTYRYAFDQVGPGDQAMGLLQDVLVSTSGLLVQLGNGTHKFINRLSRTYTLSSDTFTEDDMVDLRVPSERASAYDGVVIEVPQIEIGVAPEVLARETGEDRDPVPAGETIERWLEYRDPLDTATSPVRVAGTDMIQPDDAVPDYEYNSQADGLGTDLTADMVITAEFFSGTCKLTIENTSGSTAYRIILQVRGTAIRRFQPRVVTSGDISGTKVLRIQSPFQGSTSAAQFQADILFGQFGTTLQRPTEVAILPQQSERLMAHALLREPGDRISLVEPVTGLAADAIIHGIYLSVTAPCWIAECRWTLAPQSSYLFIAPWRWGIAGKSEWDETTVYA